MLMATETNPTNLQNAERLRTLFRCKKIVWDEIDGTDPGNEERRSELVGVSGLRAEYPQVFLLDRDSCQYSFVGDYSKVSTLHENAAMIQENPTVLDMKPDLADRVFDKVFAEVPKVGRAWAWALEMAQARACERQLQESTTLESQAADKNVLQSQAARIGAKPSKDPDRYSNTIRPYRRVLQEFSCEGTQAQSRQQLQEHATEPQPRPRSLPRAYNRKKAMLLAEQATQPSAKCQPPSQQHQAEKAQLQLPELTTAELALQASSLLIDVSPRAFSPQQQLEPEAEFSPQRQLEPEAEPSMEHQPSSQQKEDEENKQLQQQPSLERPQRRRMRDRLKRFFGLFVNNARYSERMHKLNYQFTVRIN